MYNTRGRLSIHIYYIIIHRPIAERIKEHCFFWPEPKKRCFIVDVHEECNNNEYLLSKVNGVNHDNCKVIQDYYKMIEDNWRKCILLTKKAPKKIPGTNYIILAVYKFKQE